MAQHRTQTLRQIRRRRPHWQLTALARELYGGFGLGLLALLLYVVIAGGWGRP